MRVHHLDCGTLRPLGGRLLDGEPGLFRFATIVCHVLLVETEDGLLLVDTGFGTADRRRPAATVPRRFAAMMRPVTDDGQAAVTQVRALGYDPADVRHIVLTHLDLDHASGLVDFPAATVHVTATEHRAATARRTRIERERYRPAQWAHHPKWELYEPGGEPWFGLDAVRGLTGLGDDVLMVPLAGHTRGHAGVALRTDDGWLLHAGDSYFHHGEMRPKPHCTPLLSLFQRITQVDGAARLANQRRVRELALGGEVTVFSAHDALELRRLRA